MDVHIGTGIGVAVGLGVGSGIDGGIGRRASTAGVPRCEMASPGEFV